MHNTNTIAKYLGKMIRKFRVDKDITQEDLADIVGIDRSYMGHIERGEYNVSAEKLYFIARALNIEDVGQFFPSIKSFKLGK